MTIRGTPHTRLGIEPARTSLKSGQFSTDPVNLQPKVRPVLKRAADVIRKFAPKNLEQDAIDNIASSLEAPWGARIEHRIREALGERINAEGAVRVIAAAKELGLKPYQAPDPLPPIELDEVSIVCWMSVSSDKLVS